MPSLSFSKYLQNRSKRKLTRENQNNANKTANAINDFFTSNEYPFRVIDSILSVYVTTFLVETTDPETNILLEDTLSGLNKALNYDSIRLIGDILDTGFQGLQIPNPLPFDLSYQYCLDNLKDTNKLPLGIDAGNQLISLSIGELGNTLVVASPNTRKTTFIKSLLTSLIQNDKTSVNLILDNSKDNNLSLFKGHAYISKDILNSLNDLNKELDKRESILNGESFLSYNQNQIKEEKDPLPMLNVFIDEYKNEYHSLLLPLLSRSMSLGVNIIITSPFYISDFGKSVATLVVYKVNSLDEARVSRFKDAIYLLGKGDCFIRSRVLSPTHPIRIVTPYLEDKEIKRLLRH